MKSNLIIDLSNISNDDKDLVGEKAASLGEMIKHGFPFSDGFVITQNAYHLFALKHTLPDKLIKEIFRAYKHLESSLKDANVEIFLSDKLSQKKEVKAAHGEAVLIEKIKSFWQHHSSPIVVQKIPKTSKTGFMHTTNTTRDNKIKIIIYEDHTKNHYEVLKRSLKITFKAIHHRTKQNLTDKQIVHMATIGKKLQQFCYFPQEVSFAIEKNKIFITNIKPISHVISEFPPKKEQSSLIEKISTIKMPHRLKPQAKINNTNLLLKGNSIYPGIATGHLRKIQSLQDFNKILRGEVLVIPYQDLIKNPVTKAGAIVAIDDKMHQIPHLSLGKYFSGKPTVITTSDKIKILRDGIVVTVNGKNGEVYMGSRWH